MNYRINLPQTTYCLCYENESRAVVPGCNSLAKEIVQSCLPMKPIEAYYLDGRTFIPFTDQAIDRAWREIAKARELVAA